MMDSNHTVNGAGAARAFSASYRRALAAPMSGLPEPGARRLFPAKPERLAHWALAARQFPPPTLRSLTHSLALAWRVETLSWLLP